MKYLLFMILLLPIISDAALLECKGIAYTFQGHVITQTTYSSTGETEIIFKTVNGISIFATTDSCHIYKNSDDQMKAHGWTKVKNAS